MPTDNLRHLVTDFQPCTQRDIDLLHTQQVRCSHLAHVVVPLLLSNGNKTAIAAYLFSLEVELPHFELPVTYIETRKEGLFPVPTLTT